MPPIYGPVGPNGPLTIVMDDISRALISRAYFTTCDRGEVLFFLYVKITIGHNHVVVFRTVPTVFV
jgi:hypothetical protein